LRAKLPVETKPMSGTCSDSNPAFLSRFNTALSMHYYRSVDFLVVCNNDKTKR